jgi:hypothetical protein
MPATTSQKQLAQYWHGIQRSQLSHSLGIQAMRKSSATHSPRTPVAAPRSPEHPTTILPQNQLAPVDHQRDGHHADEFAKNSGNTLVARHRNGSKAIESVAEDVPEEEDQLDETFQEESGEYRRDRFFSSVGYADQVPEDDDQLEKSVTEQLDEHQKDKKPHASRLRSGIRHKA